MKILRNEWLYRSDFPLLEVTSSSDEEMMLFMNFISENVRQQPKRA